MKKVISILVLSLMIVGCSSNLSKPVVYKVKKLETNDCDYRTGNSFCNIFVAPCDCFDVGDIPSNKIMKGGE